MLDNPSASVGQLFEFRELLLTDRVLDLLEFGLYEDQIGDFGARRLNFGGDSPWYTIYDMDEIEAGVYGLEYINYTPQHFTTADFRTIYFLHELYEDILNTRSKSDLLHFVQVAGRKELHPYLYSYLHFKELSKC